MSAFEMRKRIMAAAGIWQVKKHPLLYIVICYNLKKRYNLKIFVIAKKLPLIWQFWAGKRFRSLIAALLNRKYDFLK